MKQILIDTNVLISFVTDRDPIQQEKSAKLFQKTANLKINILCHQNVLTEFIYVLDRIYHVSKNEIRLMVSDFIHLPGVEIIHKINFKSLFSCWPDPISDFGDAVIAAVGMTMKKSMIATFDRKFIGKLKLLGLNYHQF